MNRLSSGYVYCIISPDGRKYIGSTKDWSNRKNTHKNQFKDLNNKQELYVNMRELGWDNFEWNILDQFQEITLKDLRNKESEYIHKYNTLNPKYGFNKVDPRIVNYEYICDYCNEKYNINNNELCIIEFECEICHKIFINKEEYYLHENNCKTIEIEMLQKIIMKENEYRQNLLEQCRNYGERCDKLETELYELKKNIYKSQTINKIENSYEFCNNINPRYQVDPSYQPYENLSTKFVKEKFSTNIILEDLLSTDNLSRFLWCYILYKRVIRSSNGKKCRNINYVYNEEFTSEDYTHGLIDKIFDDIGELLMEKLNNSVYESLSNVIHLIKNNENLTNRINSVITSKQFDKKLLLDIETTINDKNYKILDLSNVCMIYEMINDKEQYKKLVDIIKGKIYRFIIFN